MATINLRKDNLKNTIEDNNIVLIDFWAPWCGPCKTFESIYENVAKKYQDVVFAKCNIEEEQSLATSFKIKSIPSLVICREKKLLFKHAGILTGAALDDIISQVKEIDMHKILTKNSEEAENN